MFNLFPPPMSTDSNRPLRILHVVGGMNPGGVETWLMHVLRRIDRERFRMDFLVHTTTPCAYDDEIRSLGSEIIPCLGPRNPFRYARRLRDVLARNDYTIVHSHVHHYSGLVLRVAAKAGVPTRIAHSHNDTSTLERTGSPARKLYLALMKRWIDRYATLGFACSRPAAACLFGADWATDNRYSVLYYGIDLKCFRANGLNPAAVRREIGIPSGAIVVGHVGRMAPQKNHLFLIDIFAEIRKREPRAHLLLIGDGPLRPAIEQRVQKHGLGNSVTFAGLRPDVPRLMLAAMDVFLFPSLYEGLPVVLIEAQAAGLPSVISNVVPPEVDLLSSLVSRIDLARASDQWAAAALAAAIPAVEGRSNSLQFIEQTDMNIDNGVARLTHVYSGAAVPDNPTRR